MPSSIPCDIECLITAVIKFEEVLLQRVDAERVSDREVRGRAFRRFCSYDMPAINLREQRFNTVMYENGILEGTQNAFGCGRWHGLRVLR